MVKQPVASGSRVGRRRAAKGASRLPVAAGEVPPLPAAGVRVEPEAEVEQQSSNREVGL